MLAGPDEVVQIDEEPSMKRSKSAPVPRGNKTTNKKKPAKRARKKKEDDEDEEDDGDEGDAPLARSKTEAAPTMLRRSSRARKTVKYAADKFDLEDEEDEEEEEMGEAWSE